MSELNAIQQNAKAFADARERLSGLVAALNDGIEALKRDNMPAIKRALRSAAEREAALRACIEEHPHLFVKPKTVVMHGVRVGFEKGKGKIEFEDADRVVELVLRKLPEQADVLLQTTRKPVKKALAQLAVKDLKALGCTVEEVGEVVVIRPVDTDVDKLVTALLKSATEQASEQA